MLAAVAGRSAEDLGAAGMGFEVLRRANVERDRASMAGASAEEEPDSSNLVWPEYPLLMATVEGGGPGPSGEEPIWPAFPPSANSEGTGAADEGTGAAERCDVAARCIQGRVRGRVGRQAWEELWQAEYVAGVDAARWVGCSC